MRQEPNVLRDRITIGLTILFFIAFSVYSLRGLLVPDIVSSRFGAAVSDEISLLYFRVYQSRNIALILLGLIFLALDARKPLAIVMSVIGGLPIFDASVLLAQYGSAARLTLHVGSFFPIVVIATLLWVRALSPRNSPG